MGFPDPCIQGFFTGDTCVRYSRRGYPIGSESPPEESESSAEGDDYFKYIGAAYYYDGIVTPANVIDNPSNIYEYDDFWTISFDVEKEPVPLPPVRRFNVHKDTGRTYEAPRY